MDRRYAEPHDVPEVARIAHMSPAHFSREFTATFGHRAASCAGLRGAGLDQARALSGFGNHIRITQPKQGPVEITQADVDRWSGA